MTDSNDHVRYKQLQQQDDDGDDGDVDLGDDEAGSNSDGYTSPVLQRKQGLIYPYWRLLRTNPRFRLLWFGNVVSLFGDWFNEVATITLLQDLSGDFNFEVLLTIRLIVPAVMLLVGGIAADHLDRRVLMIIADGLRCLIVLSYMLADSFQLVWLVFVLQTLQSSAASFFMPSQDALLPNLVAKEDLLVANTLEGITWSIMAFLGGGLGGFLVAFAGIKVNYTVDAISYLLSATCITLLVRTMDGSLHVLLHPMSPRAPSPPAAQTLDTSERTTQKDENDASELGAEDKTQQTQQRSKCSGCWTMATGAVQYLWMVRDVLWINMVKAFYNIGLSIFDVVTIRMAKMEFNLGHEDGSLALGVLFSAQAVGTLFGPMIARRLSDDSARSLRRWLGGCYVLSAVACLMLSWSPHAMVFNVAALFNATASATVYTFTVTLVQRGTADAVRGRVMALAQALRMGVSVVGTLSAGAMIDFTPLGTHWTGFIGAVSIALIAIIWLSVYLPKYGNREIKAMKWNQATGKYCAEEDMAVAAELVSLKSAADHEEMCE